ncbi:MAG: heparinase II/III-family protein, partial [Defluviitaleaceae bacterium]|nr:heparinase II/III-family protein [Defluviitaleaceae bacterium]
MKYNMREIGEALRLENDNHEKFQTHFANETKLSQIRREPRFAEMLAAYKSKGDELEGTPIKSILFSQYKDFESTGERERYTVPYMERRERLSAFALLSLLYGEERRYLNELEDAIWAVCDEYTWCWPMHIYRGSLAVVETGGNHIKDGLYESTRRPHYQHIDLLAAETASVLAEIISLNKSRLTPLVVDRAVREITARVFDSFLDFNNFWDWETCDMNWGSVCAGGIGSAAMYLIKEWHVLTPLIFRCVAAMDAFLGGFPDDGACLEGPLYWNYGFGHFVYFSELLLRRTGGRINLFDSDKARAVANFQQYAVMPGGRAICFSDCGQRYTGDVGITHYLKSVYPEINSSCASGQSESGFIAALRALFWSDEKLADAIQPDFTRAFRDAQWFISRATHAGKTAVFAAKGGHNEEPHNHNDLGHFILHYDGVNLLDDLGAGEYTKDYFANRYDYLCACSRGHSVPIIGGAYQKAGREWKTELVGANEADNAFSIDLTGAYGCDDLRSLIREFKFSPEQKELKLTDRYAF